MKDFNSYVHDTPKQGAGGQTADLNQMIARLAGKYEGASEERIISAIISEAEKGRRNGTLTDADLDAFASSVMPALNPKQQRKLSKVVAYLKTI